MLHSSDDRLGTGRSRILGSHQAQDGQPKRERSIIVSVLRGQSLYARSPLRDRGTCHRTRASCPSQTVIGSASPVWRKLPRKTSGPLPVSGRSPRGTGPRLGRRGGELSTVPGDNRHRVRSSILRTVSRCSPNTSGSLSRAQSPSTMQALRRHSNVQFHFVSSVHTISIELPPTSYRRRRVVQFCVEATPGRSPPPRRSIIMSALYSECGVGANVPSHSRLSVPRQDGSSTCLHLCALCTFPARSIAPSQSPNWLNTNRMIAHAP